MNVQYAKIIKYSKKSAKATSFLLRTHRTTVAMILSIPYFIPLLVVTVGNVYSAIDVYPWGTKDYYDRSDEILDTLRKNMVLDIVGDSIRIPFLSGKDRNEEQIYDGEMHVKNQQGTEFVASLSSSKKENEKKKLEADALLVNAGHLAKKFDGLCSVLPIDYWNYEWCHRNEIRQFHVEYKPNNKIERKPDWSLGKYVRSIVVRTEIGNDNSPISKLVDYYEGGQICHENNLLRRTEVHIQCCDGQSYPNAMRVDGQSSQAILSSIVEPELCTYEATVCSPLLCPENRLLTSSKVSSNNPTQLTLVEAMDVLNATCLSKLEEWWTYELCFGKGIRQIRFDVSQSVNSEGSVTQKQVITNQYYLGLPHLENYVNETALQERTSNKGRNLAVSVREKEIFESSGMLSPLFRARGRSPNFLRIEFSNGTPCDLDNVNRSAVVEAYCGPSNLLYQIREESTCTYILRAELAVLCNVPGFQIIKENITSIHFNLLHPEEFEDSAGARTVPRQVESNAADSYSVNEKQFETLLEDDNQNQLIEEIAMQISANGEASMNDDIVEALLEELDRSVQVDKSDKVMNFDAKILSDSDEDAMGENADEQSEEVDNFVEEVLGWNGQQIQ